MKYYNAEGCYKVDTLGVGTEGRMQYGAIMIDAEEKEHNIVSIEPSCNKTDIEIALADYAKEHELYPELIWKIKKGERVLQGTPETKNDFIPIDDAHKARAFEKYLAHKNAIGSYEAEKASKIEALKKEYKEKIEAEVEELEAIESVVRTGTLKEECQASWERDLENGVMLLIRHDNLKVLQWRKMTEAEAQVTIDDPEANINEE
jgi:hypothetical protein